MRHLARLDAPLAVHPGTPTPFTIAQEHYFFAMYFGASLRRTRTLRWVDCIKKCLIGIFVGASVRPYATLSVPNLPVLS